MSIFTAESKLKEILKAPFVLAYFFLLCTSVSAQMSVSELEDIISAQNDSLTSVAISPKYNEIAVSMRAGEDGQIVVISLSDCMEKKRYNYPNNVNFVIYAKKNPAYLWASIGDTLKKINSSDGTEAYSESVLGQPIIGLSQSFNGDYLAVWSQSRFALLNISKDIPEIICAEEVRFSISSMAIDHVSGAIYISGYDGSLVKKTYSGNMLNSFDLQAPIYSIAFDNKNKLLFLGMDRGLLAHVSDSPSFTRISSVPAHSVKVSDDSKYVAAVGNSIYSLYSVPGLKLIKTVSVIGNKLELLFSGNAVSYGDNEINFYNMSGSEVSSKIYISNLYSGMVSSDYNYFGGDAFIDAVNSGNTPIPSYILSDRKPNKIKACNPIRYVINPDLIEKDKPLVAPKNQSGQSSRPNIGADQVKKPEPAVSSGAGRPNVEIPQVNTPKIGVPQVNTPKVNVPSASVKAPQTPFSVQAPQAPLSPQTPAAPSVTAPKAPVMGPADLTPGADIPSWVMRPNDLPNYSVVRQGIDSASALTSARAKIREDVARDVMKRMLEVELVKDMQDPELKKRFLWMVGGKTGLLSGQYAIQRDLWISPEENIFILVQVDKDTVDKIYEPIFQEEMDQLKRYGVSEYLKRDPIKWD